MAQSFVQVPPQSTGKRLLTEFRKELYFEGQVRTIFVNDQLIGETSGATGIVSAVIVEGFADGTGLLYLKLFSGDFVDNENLLRGTSTVAVTNISANFPQTDYDVQKVILTDPDNPQFTQKIDRFGATVNTFTDGSPVFGPFGTLTVGEPQVIKTYRFTNGIPEGVWDIVTTGTATAVWEPNKTATIITTGVDPGDKVSKTTNYYHPYVPGVGINVEFTAQLGDSGKENLRRRWGYFDENDGVFFELNGTELFIVIRSSVSGTVVEQRVPQEEWNQDRADGTNNIAFDLDLTKANMFWTDMQWHGAGRVRVGVYEPDGSRVPLHYFKFANNTNGYPYMKTGSLPVRFEQENLAGTVSVSQMRYTSAVVRYTSKVILTGTKHSYGNYKTVTPSDGEVPIFAYRPKITFNGVTNRAILKVLSNMFANTATSNETLIFRVRQGTEDDLTDAGFVSHTDNSIAEVDKVATAVNTNSRVISSYIVSANQSLYVPPTEPTESNSYELSLNASATVQPTFIITAECLGGTQSNAVVYVNWEEVAL
jgi:hypothetical protein